MSSLNGDFLMVCWTGNNNNGGTNVATAPLLRGFTVLAVSRTGYGASTGWPFPSSEACTVAAVLELAATVLGFPPTSTQVYGWSMGGSNIAMSGAFK